MNTTSSVLFLVLMLGASAWPGFSASSQATPLPPDKMARIASVDDRFQSYNVEMLEVTGGKFWKPYSSLAKPKNGSSQGAGKTPAGMDPNMYEYRAPVDLTNSRLRRLAAALGPAYVRVSGTWANTTYFNDKPGSSLQTPPTGFSGVLTAAQWKGVVDFARAVNARIVTSVAISAGTRDTGGHWTAEEANKLWAYTRSVGGQIAATEFMNEPTAPSMGGAPEGYDAKAYAEDLAQFRTFLKQHSPETLLLGPGSVGEGSSTFSLPGKGFIYSTDLLAATGPAFDGFSFHLYPAVSQRCSQFGPKMGTTFEDALTAEWLQKPVGIEAFYARLRDKFEPGKSLWLTETAEAACGGDPWASTFLDTFRYVNQLGLMARLGVQVVMHNTLAASDYALLHEGDFQPRPNFWAALLWHKLMGTTVLEPGPSPSANLHLYAHCLPGVPGGVTVLAINADQKSTQELSVPSKSRQYTLSAESLMSAQVRLNGAELKLGEEDAMPSLNGSALSSRTVRIAPATISFVTIPAAGNSACRP